MVPVDHYLALAGPYLHEYGYAAAFMAVFLESFGLPLPGETLMIAAAVLSSKGGLNVVPLYASVWVAAVLGDNIGYVIGRLGGRRLVLRYGERVGITESRLATVEWAFGRYGAKIVLLARFFLVLRQLNGVISGLLAMPWWRFLLYNAIGATLWTAFWVIGVYLLVRNAATLPLWPERFGYLSLGAAAIGVTGALVVRALKKRSPKQ